MNPIDPQKDLSENAVGAPLDPAAAIDFDSMTYLEAQADATVLVTPRRETRPLEPLPELQKSSSQADKERIESQVFERYSHVRELGQGAMGIVALMQDVLLRRQVAYKQIKAEALDQENILEQFLSEAQITSQLEHPGVVPIYSLEILPSGEIAYAMKVVEGQTLKERLEKLKGPLQQNPKLWPETLVTLLEDFLKVCDAMAYAHSKGVIHRDLKPSNIMFGLFHEVYILDWGIAKVFDAKAGVTVSHPVDDSPPEGKSRPLVGTPRYMSPEQIKGIDLNDASDLFTLGLILQEVVCLQTAVQAKTLQEAILKVLKPDQRPIVHALGLPVPAALKAIIQKATAIKISERYANVQALADELRLVLQDQAPKVLPDNLWHRCLRWIRNNSAKAMVAAMSLFLICAIAIGGSLWLWQETLKNMRDHKLALELAFKQSLMASQRLDSHFGKFEALLAHVASAASEAWLRGQPDGPELIDAEKLKRSRDLFQQSQYEQIFWQGPLQKSKQLSVLLPHFQAIFARAQNPDLLPSQWLKKPLSPITELYLQIGNVHLLYPLSLQSPRRLEDFQKALAQTDEIQWLQPIENEHVRVLPLSMALQTAQHQAIGQASLLINDNSIENAISPQALKAYVSNWIVDRQLHLIHGTVATLPDAIQEAIQAGKSGYFEQDGALWIYQPLATQNWTLVLKFELKTLIEASHD